MQRQNTSNPTYLDTNSKSVHEKLCPRRPSIVIVNDADPTQFFFAGCDAYACPVCGPRKTNKLANAIAWQQDRVPLARLFTFTNAPVTWQQRRQKMRSVAHWARSKGYDWNVAWTTEQGSKTGMIHIHAIHYGDFMPRQELMDRWGALIDLRLIKSSQGAASSYISKAARQSANYISKGKGDQYAQWLDLNGGRPMHITRGYFGEYSTREAVKLAQRAMTDTVDIMWRPATDAEAFVCWELYNQTRT